jgi:hypothetical protein
LIFLLLLLPLAAYLFVLGLINRRRFPLMVSGTADLIGLLAGCSGFVVFGGPTLLSIAYERWRLFWLLGQGWASALRGPNPWAVWVCLFALYFFGVVGAAAYLFRQRRHHTCVYNADPETVEQLLDETCEHLGLAPVRSGNVYLFGLPAGALEPRPGAPAGLQAPHARPDPDGIQPMPALLPAPEAGPTAAGEALAGQCAVLEVEPFPLLRHVILRWEKADAPLRREVDAELERRLAEAPTEPHEVGGWMVTLAGLLFAASLLIGLVLVLRWTFRI